MDESMSQAIHQFSASFAPGDAISNSVRLMRDVFLSWGKTSYVFCEGRHLLPADKPIARDLSSAGEIVKPSDIAVLHLSVGHPVNSVFAGLPCRKVILYHNITPAKYFDRVNPSVSSVLASGREDLRRLNGCAQLNLAVSAYNAAELVEAGYRDVRVLPLPIDIGAFTNGDCDPSTVARLQDGSFNILFVGRFVPNKKIEDLLKVMFYLKGIEPRARLVYVGSTISKSDVYVSFVRATAKTLVLENIEYMSSVPQNVLNACYSTAHAFLCMSEHEGFCAPLVEAMISHVPVFSLATSAVPETLGGAGVMFQSPPDYMLVAETIAEVLHNDSLRNAIIAKQDARVASLRNRDLASELKVLFAPLLSD